MKNYLGVKLNVRCKWKQLGICKVQELICEHFSTHCFTHYDVLIFLENYTYKPPFLGFIK